MMRLLAGVRDVRHRLRGALANLAQDFVGDHGRERDHAARRQKQPLVERRQMEIGDCTRVLPNASRITNVKLLFTSPPYFRVTNYYVDQWLRNWMLGGPSRPCSGEHAYMKRFDNKDSYRALLKRTFTSAAQKLLDDAVICVRTDARKFALQTTKEVLREIFPAKRMLAKTCSLNGRLSQTALFGDKQQKPGEVDLVLQ